MALRDGTKIRAPDYFRIVCEVEPRLVLLREWNLFDSMVSSSYVATKLRTWSENGLKKLKILLANMGYGLPECRKKFQYTINEGKLTMKDEFERFLQVRFDRVLLQRFLTVSWVLLKSFGC